jgi:uncharacterized repeat protein (TIGR03803 family)
MSLLRPPESLVQVGGLQVDLSTGEVRRDGQRVPIPDQPTRLLLVLLETPGKIVSREELRKRLWPDDTYVEFNHSIHAAVNKLRQALRDSPKQPKFIETIARRGYRLMAPIQSNILHTFAGETGGSNPFSSLLRDSSGNLYGTSVLGGSPSAGTVFKVTP